MCFKDFPRARTLYTEIIKFKKIKISTARQTFTSINKSYHISLEYELDVLLKTKWRVFLRQEFFKHFSFDLHRKTNIKIQTDTSYSTIDNNTETFTSSHNNNHFNIVLLHMWKNINFSILIMALQGKYITSNLLREAMCTRTHVSNFKPKSAAKISKHIRWTYKMRHTCPRSKGVVSKHLPKANIILEL